MVTRPSQYIHGSSPPEQERLTLLNILLNDAALQHIDLRGGERILDAGSGLGQFTRAMARAAGPGSYVVGIERDDQQRMEALRQAQVADEADLVAFRPGDAFHLPLASHEWNSFDVAHARFLLEHVPNPVEVVRQMALAVRPGGRVLLADDDHATFRLWPEPPGFFTLWEAYMRSYDRLGNDPYIGRRLVALLYEAGLQPVRNALLFFGGCTGDASFLAVVENLYGVLFGAREVMMREGLLDAETLDHALEAFLHWGNRPDAAIWYTVCWAEGRKPESNT